MPMVVRIVVALAAVACAQAQARAETRYVSPRGADEGDGIARPWQSLQYAADHVVAGDTVMVAPGMYRGFDVGASGSAEQPIRFVAEAGAVIHLDSSETPDGINVENASWVEIEGFTINGVSRAGIRAAECGAVTIRRNKVVGPGMWGIFTGFCDDLLIEDNEVVGAKAQHGIYVSNSGDRPIIRRNHLWDNHEAGIHVNGDVNEGGDGVITGALIEENHIHGNGAGGGAGINMDGVEDSVIRNNLIYNERANGITMYRIDGGRPSSRNRIVNNTIVLPEKTRWGIRIYDGSIDNTILNNIVWSDHEFRGAYDISADSVPGLRSDFNVLIGRFTLDDAETILSIAQWRKETGLDAHSVIVDDKGILATFADWRNDDYRLRPGSPAVDAGADDGHIPTRDLLGFARKVNGTIDVGAYELCAKDACVALDLPPDPPRQGRTTPTLGERGGGSGGGGEAGGEHPGAVDPGGGGCCGPAGGDPRQAACWSVLVLYILKSRWRRRSSSRDATS